MNTKASIENTTLITEDNSSPVPKVSIGMPVYNGGHFIREALDSLLAQTFTDFELIISDNASTDDTEEICREYATRDLRIRYVRQQRNMGGFYNFRFVLEQATGEYFMMAAYDDVRKDNFIEKLLNGFKSNEVVSSFCVCREIDQNGNVINDRIDFDFSGKSPISRVWKYSIDKRALRDIPIYGIHKRNKLLNYRSKPWGWINKSNPVNSAHPVMIYLLASGKLWVFQEDTLFDRRVVTQQAWKADVVSRGVLVKKIAFIVLKAQLFFRSADAVFEGSKSIWVTLATLPAVLYASLRPIAILVLGPIYRLIRKFARPDLTRY